MKGKPAALLFLGICVVLAALLLTRCITSMMGSLAFALALLVLGGLSRGFKRA
jgi:hypothetical protein